jgi:serine/threonine protein kinase
MGQGSFRCVTAIARENTPPDNNGYDQGPIIPDDDHFPSLFRCPRRITSENSRPQDNGDGQAPPIFDNYHFPPLRSLSTLPQSPKETPNYGHSGLPQNSCDELPFLEVLGSGAEGFCTLHRANITSEKLVVVKHSNSVRAPEKTNRTLVTNELNILMSLIQQKNGRKRRANVIEILGTVTSDTGDRCLIKFAYCEGGTLGALMEKHEKAGTLPSRAFVRHVQLQLSVALAFIHTGCTYDYLTMKWTWPRDRYGWIPVIHRDIKPENILLSHTDKSDLTSDFPDIILGDFGHAIALKPFESYFPNYNTHVVLGASKTTFSTQEYAPPEYFNRKAEAELEGDEAFDWWQVGATLFELCMQRLYSPESFQLPLYCGLGFASELRRMLEEHTYWRFNDYMARSKFAEWHRIRDTEDPRDRLTGPTKDTSWGSKPVGLSHMLNNQKDVDLPSQTRRNYKSFSGVSEGFFD